MTRTPPQFVFARAMSVMLHPGPLSLLSLVVLWMVVTPFHDE
jgi:hypothetical protein